MALAKNLIDSLNNFPTLVPLHDGMGYKPDFDFWYDPTCNNYFNLLNALEELGQDISAFKQHST